MEEIKAFLIRSKIACNSLLHFWWKWSITRRQMRKSNNGEICVCLRFNVVLECLQIEVGGILSRWRLRIPLIEFGECDRVSLLADCIELGLDNVMERVSVRGKSSGEPQDHKQHEAQSAGALRGHVLSVSFPPALTTLGSSVSLGAL